MSNEVVNKSIYDKIIDRGSLEALEIINQGKQKAEIIEKEIIDEATKDSELLLNKNAQVNQDKLKAAKTNFERFAKKEILFKKKELIEELFKVAHSKLKALNDIELFDLVKKHIQKENITGNEIIKVNKSEYGKYLSLFSSGKPSDLVVLDKLNRALGEGYNLKLGKDHVDIDGGFIIESENFDIDFSFASILNVIKESDETMIANILFNEEN